MENYKKKIIKDLVFCPKIWFWGSPGRDLFSQHRGFQFGAILGTDIFGDTPPPNIDQNPHPYSGLSQSLPGPHASLWTDQIPDLRIYVVIAVWGPSFVPNSQFPSFSGGPGKAHHPSLTTSLQS